MSEESFAYEEKAMPPHTDGAAFPLPWPLFSGILPFMLKLTREGLYCAAGDFYIDPRRGVDRAVVTHAHADHARRGSRTYFCVKSGVDLLKARLGPSIRIQSYDYSEVFQFGDVKVSFHPAGHILGSCQVRIEAHGEVWVASGDYKREADPTCEPFETVPCDVFVTEATFGTPTYIWPPGRKVGKEMYDWWQTNAGQGYNSVIFGYSLGKTQRILGELQPFAQTPIYLHPAAAEITEAYRRQNIALAETLCLSQVSDQDRLTGALVVAPQSFMKTERVQILGERYRTAFASGWMARGSWGYDQGFLLSDHADWNDLVRTIQETGARQVYVQHRGSGALVKHLNHLGIKAYPESALESKTPDQLAFF